MIKGIQYQVPKFRKENWVKNKRKWILAQLWIHFRTIQIEAVSQMLIRKVETAEYQLEQLMLYKIALKLDLSDFLSSSLYLPVLKHLIKQMYSMDLILK